MDLKKDYAKHLFMIMSFVTFFITIIFFIFSNALDGEINL